MKSVVFVAAVVMAVVALVGTIGGDEGLLIVLVVVGFVVGMITLAVVGGLLFLSGLRDLLGPGGFLQ